MMVEVMGDEGKNESYEVGVERMKINENVEVEEIIEVE